MVLSDARKVGIQIDEANFKRQYERAIEDLTGTRVDTKGYALWGRWTSASTRRTIKPK